jgi:EAL domain-containing protein (putative c-di-GMP-specific phosphodiesterase class I)
MEPFLWDQRPVSLTVSIGMVRVVPSLTSIEEVLSIGRVAVLKSKTRRKNRVSLPDDTSTAAAWLTPTLRTFLEVIRSAEGVDVRAQPIVRLDDGRPTGWELLVRGPAGPLESPADLFRMAEEHQLSTTLDMSCLRRASQAGHDLRKPGQIHLNLLPVTLLEVPTSQVLETLGPPPPRARWCVELSERQFVGEPQELFDAVEALRVAGVGLAIDDVGSGRGTLDSVIALEREVMKLDIRLVKGIAEDSRRRRMVERLLRMAYALDTEVVAEGIETRADLTVLRELGVQQGQGFVWGRPQLVPRRT